MTAHPWETLPARAKHAVDILDYLFKGRRDVYNLRRPQSRGGPATYAPLSKDVLAGHVMGDYQVGVYPIWRQNGKEVVQWIAFDIDCEGAIEKAVETAQKLLWAKTKLQIPIYFERSKGKGIHAFYWMDAPIEVWKARAVGRFILETCELGEFKERTNGCTRELKVYPLQDSAREETGSCLYLPWFGGSAKEQKTLFLDPTTWEPYRDQVAVLETAELASAENIDSLVEINELRPQNVTPLHKDQKRAEARREDAPPPAERVPPGGMGELSEGELTVLSKRLRTLKKAVNAATELTYDEWLGALTHLVPFNNGNVLAHRISQLDGARYNARDVDYKWEECVKLYSRPDRVTTASTSQLIVESIRTGGRDDLTPISHIYGIHKGVFCRRTWTLDQQRWKEGDPMPLCNFSARIDAEEHETNGVEVIRKFIVSGYLQNGQRLLPTEILSEKWAEHNQWVHKAWGIQPYIFIGRHHAQMVKECLALTARESPTINTYSHTGWAKVEGRDVFLTASGPVGFPEGSRDALSLTKEQIRLPATVSRFEVPPYSTEEQARTAYQLIEKHAAVAHESITAPILASMFLAPLASHLPIDFTLYLYGTTGCRKSSLLASWLNLFGTKFTKDTMCANFQSTWNAIEHEAFAAKDLPFVVDNYIPDERRTAQTILQKIIQAVGDHAGRSRLNAACEHKEGKAVRSLIFVTGEDSPQRNSSVARSYCVEFQIDSINNGRLSQLQEDGYQGRMAPAMSHYIRWLQARLAEPDFIKKVVEAHHSTARALQAELEKNHAQVHGRISEQECWLRIGLQLMKWSNPNGTFTEGFVEGLESALVANRGERAKQMRETSLAFRFLITLTSMCQAGEIRAIWKCEPQEQYVPECWGWMPRDGYDGFWDPITPTSKPLFWIDEEGPDFTILVPPDMMVALCKRWAASVEPMPESTRAIAASLVSAGILVEDGDEQGRLTHRIWAESRSHRVWVLRGRKILNLLQITKEPTPCQTIQAPSSSDM